MAAGLAVQCLGNLQEGLFVACALAGSRVRPRLPRGGPWLRSALLWAALLLILTQVAFAFNRESGGDPAFSGLMIVLSGAAGGLLGTVLAVGARSIEDKSYGWLDGWWAYCITLFLAVVAAVGSAALVAYTTGAVFEGLAPPDASGYATGRPGSGLAVVLIFFLVVGGLIAAGALAFQPLLRGFLSEVAPRARGAVVVAALALPVAAAGIAVLAACIDSAALPGSDPNGAPRRIVLLLDHYGGAVASWLFVAPLGVAAGALLGGVRRRTSGKGPSRAWGAFGFRLGAAAAAVATLAAVTIWRPPGPQIQLDVTAYFGPGPLLTTLERLIRGQLGLPVALAWWMVFLGKFVVLALPMAAGGALTAWLLRRRQPS
jgi:hypothetical protein